MLFARRGLGTNVCCCLTSSVINHYILSFFPELIDGWRQEGVIKIIINADRSKNNQTKKGKHPFLSKRYTTIDEKRRLSSILLLLDSVVDELV